MIREKWAVSMAKVLLEEQDEGAISAALLRSVNHENTINRLEISLRECYEYFEKNADGDQIWSDAAVAIMAIVVRTLQEEKVK
jgi:hypothetical protein